jgi:hypothetical protein
MVVIGSKLGMSRSLEEININTYPSGKMETTLKLSAQDALISCKFQILPACTQFSRNTANFLERSYPDGPSGTF